MCWHADTLPFILQVDLGPLFGLVGVPDVVACGLLAFCLQLILLFKQGHGVVQVRLDRTW